MYKVSSSSEWNSASNLLICVPSIRSSAHPDREQDEYGHERGRTPQGSAQVRIQSLSQAQDHLEKGGWQASQSGPVRGQKVLR